MKTKLILGIILFLYVTSGTYIYYNRYSFFKYLPAIEDNKKVRNINGKLSVEDGKPFTGRLKKANDEYMDIYSYKDGELNGLNVIYFKNQIKEIGHWKDGKQNGNFKLYTEEGVLVDNTNFKDGEKDGVTEQYYSDNGNLRLKINFKNGVIEGEYIAYYPNGKIYISKNNLQGSLTYYSMILLVDKYKPSPSENNPSDSLEKIKANVKIGYLDEVEYPGLVNKNKPYEIYLVFISNEMELLKGARTLKIYYEGENSTPCWLDFDLSGLEEASKSLKTKLIF